MILYFMFHSTSILILETGPLTECELWLNRKPGLRELVFEGDRTSH